MARRYTANWRYESSYKFQPLRLEAGQVVNLDDDVAEHIGRDSPGALTLVVETPVQVEVESARMVDTPPQDRAVRRRRDREGDPSDQGPIDKKGFKAVRS